MLLSAVSAAQQYQAFVLQSPDTIQNLANGVSQGQGAGTYYTNSGEMAMYWPDLSGPAVSLNPAGANDSYANGIFGNQVGGAVNSPATGNNDHAALWTGGSSAFLDLHPAIATGTISALYGVGQGMQVGYAEMTTSSMPFFSYHPFLWMGSAASAVDLWPGLPGATHGVAAGCGGNQEVGWMVFNDAMHPFFSQRSHAFLWTGSAASALDLHPASGFTASAATGTDGSQQVGYGVDSSAMMHALLWFGNAASVVDLTPDGATGARAYACGNGFQVGYVTTAGGGQHAALWNGSAESFVDLDANSSSGFTNSVATGIDANGNIVGYTNFGLYGAVAVMWAPVKVVDNPPVADAGPNQTIQANGATMPVVLNGSNSYDPDPNDTLTYLWTDQNGNVVGSDAVANLSLAAGSYTFTLVVTDNHGMASQPSTTQVTILAAAPLSINGLSADPNVVKCSDRHWVTVTVSYSLKDGSDPNPAAVLSVTSSDLHDRDDAKVVDAHHVKVRADKRDRRKGRVYTITVSASDKNGQTANENVTVTVPAEHRNKRGGWDWDCH
ncbi:MAG TPA: PKD domain-containing protein [Fimbriimonadaceae bacterium]|nr:PKD domain-containing protein [Fimbriimonadaceae bacterium]